jgi:hypothetical protein
MIGEILRVTVGVVLRRQSAVMVDSGFRGWQVIEKVVRAESAVEVKHVDGDRQWRCGMLRDSAWFVGEVEKSTTMENECD